jgi:hypothetical protein
MDMGPRITRTSHHSGQGGIFASMFAQFIGVCSSVETCSKEEGRGKGRGEKAYKVIAEEQTAFHSICEAAYTVNDLQRVQ